MSLKIVLMEVDNGDCAVALNDALLLTAEAGLDDCDAVHRVASRLNKALNLDISTHRFKAQDLAVDWTFDDLYAEASAALEL